MKLQFENPKLEEQGGGPGRFRVSIRMLIGLIACCGVGFWASRGLWDPVLIAVGELRDPIPSKRVDAVQKLSRIGRGRYETVIPPLTVALVDAEPQVRVAAVGALTSLCSDAVAEGLADRVVADVVAALIGTLKDPDRETRKAAVNSLETITSLHGVADAIDHRAVVGDLARALADPAVGPIDSGAVVAMFAETLADPHNELRPLVMHSLATSRVAERFAPPKELVAILEDDSAADRAAAVRALGGFFCPLDPWIPTLFRLLEHGEPRVRAACAEVLDRTSPNAASTVSIPVLVEALASSNGDVRLHAARALQPLAKDPRAAEAIPALLVILRKSLAGSDRHGNRQPNTRLSDPDPADETTELAIRLLSQVGPASESAAEIVAVLAEAVRAEVPNLGRAAADALGWFRSAAEPALFELLTNPKPDMRACAADKLAGVLWAKPQDDPDRPAVLAALLKRLGDDHADVRVKVLGALGALAHNSSDPPPAELAHSLADKYPGVRMAAVETLARYPCGLDRWIKDIFEVLECAPRNRIGEATYTLLKVRPQRFSAPAISAMIAALGSRHPSVRCCAAHLLGTLGPDAVIAVPALIAALSSPYDATIDGQWKLGDPQELDPAYAAMDALYRIAPGTPSESQAVQALTDVVKNGHGSRRAAAAGGLTRFGPGAVSAVPTLIDAIKENAKPGAQFWQGAQAAFALAKIAPDSPAADEAIALLTEAVGVVSWDTREITVNALAAFGPRAQSALPALRALRLYPDSAIRSAVAKAIIALGANE
jgi:HEAT repeat protein